MSTGRATLPSRPRAWSVWTITLAAAAASTYALDAVATSAGVVLVASGLLSGLDHSPADAMRTTAAGADPERNRRGAVVTYLIVGLDRNTLAPWHENIRADDLTTARRLALARAEALGVSLVVAAVIGPNSTVVPDSADRPARASMAA